MLELPCLAAILLQVRTNGKDEGRFKLDCLALYSALVDCMWCHGFTILETFFGLFSSEFLECLGIFCGSCPNLPCG